MALFNKHTVREGDRWDTIAYQWYGDASVYPKLIKDNPHLSITGDLRAGELVYLRTDLDANTNTVTEDVPPWLR